MPLIPPESSKISDIYLLIAQYPMLASRIRRQMRANPAEQLGCLGVRPRRDTRGDLLQETGIKVISPKVRRGLGVVLLKRLAGTVPPRLHAQEQDSMSVGEERAWLPGDLGRDVEFQVAEAAAVGVYQRGLAL